MIDQTTNPINKSTDGHKGSEGCHVLIIIDHLHIGSLDQGLEEVGGCPRLPLHVVAVDVDIGPPPPVKIKL